MIIYRFAIATYGFAARVMALWNAKARDFVEGRQEIDAKIAACKLENKPVFWLHAASLGEFEQGRPVLESFKAANPDWKFVVSFFSPSGYNLRKNYAQADLVCYLPLDSPSNAKRFIAAINPQIAVFVKYEFWYYTLTELHQKNIPTYLICANFRRNQLFFKPYGKDFLAILHYFEHIFVQKQDSLTILNEFGLKKASISGDTRLDRSLQVANQAKSFPIVDYFTQNQEKTLVCGSTWQEDEDVIIDFLKLFFEKNKTKNLKIIIAPHEIKEEKLLKLSQKLPCSSVRYSHILADTSVNVREFDALIIDNIGMLASLYRYGNFAYIGGAFGDGLHNIIEAAVFGVPVFFGNKNYKKFGESLDLIAAGGGFAVKNGDDLFEIFNQLSDETAYNKAATASRNYVQSNQGATKMICAAIKI